MALMRPTCFVKMTHLIGSSFKLLVNIGENRIFGYNYQITSKIHVITYQLCPKKIPNDWLIQFEQENDLIYGPTLNVDVSDNNGKEKVSPIEIVNNYAEVLPATWNSNDLINFPLANPWRLKANPDESEKTTEIELIVKRKMILENNNLKINKFPSVTKVIGETMPASSRQALERWKKRMIEKLGEEEFKEYQQKVFRRGHALHSSIAKRLEEKSVDVKITDEISGYWKSLDHVFTNITNVRLLEKPVTHPFLCYRGIVDCVANYQKTCYLIDWKTSSRPKPTLYDLYDEPLQVVSYLGALNFDAKYDYQVIKAAIVIAYEDGSPAHVHRLTESLCKTYWMKWIKRLDQYWSSIGLPRPKQQSEA